MRAPTNHVSMSHRVDDISAVFYYGALEFLDQRSPVIRLFAGYSMCLKALVLLGFSAQFAVSSVYADGSPNMLSIPTQTVVAEQLFTYRIVVESQAQTPIGMRLINAPKGVTLSDNRDGSHELRWTPPADVSEQTVIIVQAYNLAEPGLISTQRVVLERGSAEQVKAAKSAAKSAAATSVVVASNNAIGSRFSTSSNNATTSTNTATTNTAPAKPKPVTKPVAARTVTNTPAAKTATAVANTETSTAASITAKSPAVETDVNKTNSTSNAANIKTELPASIELPVSAAADVNQPVALANSANSANSEESGGISASSNAGASNGSGASNSGASNNVESIASSRPELPELGLQKLTVGEEFQFFIRPVAPDNAQLELSAQSLPVGATFEEVFEGSKMLRWKPTADQVGEHQMVLVLVAEDASDLSLRTEREVIFEVEPAPPVELAPMLLFEPMSAQIVSAGRKVNIRVDPIVSDEKIALLHVDRLPNGGSFDENKDGTRTFHWPTTQADQGEHTFRFTAIHPDNADLVANVNVLIVVGSPDGPAGAGPNTATTEVAPQSPEVDVYPSAESPPPPAPPPSPESPSPEMAPSVDSPSPEPSPSADTASPEPLAVKPPPAPRPTPD